MRKYHILVVLALLIGCGNVESEHRDRFDDSSHGLRVRYDDGGANDPSAETLYKVFASSIRCADMIGPQERRGLGVNPPLVLIVAPGTNDPYDGLTYYATGTIKVERQWVGDRGLWIHEFERWISYSRGVPTSAVDDAPEMICRYVV